MSKEPEKFVLEKRIWTDKDYDKMSWHDVIIHAIALNHYRRGEWFSTVSELMFDIDYILKCVLMPDKHYSCWVAPATLLFNNVTDLKINDNSGNGDWEIQDDIYREKVEPNDPPTWLWKIMSEEIAFKSTGFSQYIRRDPTFQGARSFTVRQRGGISFETQVQREFET